MPNAFAYMMLATWPLVCLILFLKLPKGRAFLWSMFGAYLLLPPHPASFDFPLLPPFNKLTLINLSVFFIVWMQSGKKIDLLPEGKAIRVLLFVFVFSPIATVFVNGDPVMFVTGGLRGLWPRDSVALVITQVIILLPFLLARKLLAEEGSQRDLLVVLCISGLLYSLPMLAEVRLSPQLNLWIYGYFQHIFEQSIRAGGYRPIVFLYHGIWVAFFAMTAVVATVALWRVERSKQSLMYLLGAVYLVGVVLLCKTLASIIYLLVLVPLVAFFPVLLQIRVAAILVTLALSYPVLKGVNLVPMGAMLQQVETVSSERATSLRIRFENEEMLLARANEKPLFGWGSWGRNQIHNSIDGTITTISDGRWIITMGVFGWIGFFAEFGLLSLPIFLVGYQFLNHSKDEKRPRYSPQRVTIPMRRVAPEVAPISNLSPYVGVLSLLLAVNLIDLLPNATLTSLTWIIAGALLGHAELRAKENKKTTNVENNLTEPAFSGASVVMAQGRDK
jgi:hypothetical protein